jgi:flagellar hook-associated protein 1 FlgK
MSLTAALNAAVSGLRTTQAGMDVVASNVANANSIGYSRRTLAPIQSMTGDRTSGVRTGDIERVLDTIVQKQLRLETSGAAYTSTMARFAGELDRLFGEPGTVGALDTSLNNFTAALQGLAADPASFSARSAVLNAGGILAGHIAGIAESVQTLRSEAEGRIATAVGRVNHLLKGIAELDANIISSPSSATAPGLLDERDRLITELSQLVDVHVLTAPNGSVTLTTTGGLTLFNGGAPVALSFDARGKLGPEAVYSRANAERGVGTIKATTLGGISIDVVAGDLIRSGEIGAALEVRDGTLVQAQRQLDELAAGLARALSDRAVTGTSAGGGIEIDLTGLQNGNAVTVDYMVNGAPRRVLLVPTHGAAPATIPAGDTSDPHATVIRFDVSPPGGIDGATALADIQNALTSAGIGLTVSAPTPGSDVLRFVSGVATTSLTGVAAGITATGLTGGNAQFPFFVDSGANNAAYTGSFEQRSQLVGFAQRIRVNPALQSNRAAALVNFAAPPATTPQGDATRPQFLVDALTKATRPFSSAAGIGGKGSAYVSTVADFTRRLVETHGANAEAAQRLDEGQSIALAAVEARFAEKSGVNVDHEMSQLVQLQTAYGANARVMTAIRDLLDILMRI